MEVLAYLAPFVALVIVGVGILTATTFMGRQSIPDGLEISGLRIVKDGFVSISVLRSTGERRLAVASPLGTPGQGRPGRRRVRGREAPLVRMARR